MKTKIYNIIFYSLLLLLTLIALRRPVDINRGEITVLNYGIQQLGLLKRKSDSQKLANYMYKRIKSYQKYNNLDERTELLWYIYEELEKEKNNGP